MAVRSAGDKLRWLVSHPEFRRRPMNVLTRVAFWEKVRRAGKPTELTLGPYQIRARPNDGFGRLVCYFGEAADEMFDFFKHYLKPGMQVVDVGANIGTHTIYAAGLVGASGGVHAVEPEPNTRALLNENIALNRAKNVIVHACCAANERGVLRLNINADSAKTSLVHESAIAIDVPADTLDHLLPADMRIDLLKIDVEGADYDVLLGAVGIFALRPPRVVVIETLEHSAEVNGFLTARGYSLFNFDASDGTLHELDSAPLNTYAVHESVLRVPAGWHAWRIVQERANRLSKVG
jgi:FkbM family methyltransferase